MGEIYSLPGLLPPEGEPSAGPIVPGSRDFDTGVLPYQRLISMWRSGAIKSAVDLDLSQFQPASLDLRLGNQAYRVRASFLPGPNATVMDKIKELDGLPAINLDEDDGAVFERRAVYLVPLRESVNLNYDVFGVANPKSSTGRLDILTRLITDRATEFDRIEKGYKGPLFIEICPLSFSLIVKAGVRLNQVRFQRDRGASGGQIAQQTMQKLYEQGQLVQSTTSARPPLRDGVLVPVTVDLVGKGPGSIIGYKAKKNTNKIDVSKVGFYDPKEFWDEIRSSDGRLNLDEGDFYILATKEDVGVPPNAAAEMVPYDARSGEFRVHYAGFFDPGFGWSDGKASGSKAVLEVRSYGVSFTIEDGQIVGWLRYAPIASGATDKLYGTADIMSNYQGQGVALAKHFKKWPLLEAVRADNQELMGWWQDGAGGGASK